MNIYCTLFDSNYLTRGLALIHSLRSLGDSNLILITCLDRASHEYLKPREKELNIETIYIETLVDQYPELQVAKKNRGKIEFYFTCTPFVIKYAIEKSAKESFVTYLDADLYFFRNPQNLFEEINGNSVAIIPHNYPWFLKSLERKYGRYNVGLLSFVNNTEGNRVLNWWASECIEWCYDFPSEGKYADQGYLDKFSDISSCVITLTNPGYNLAPWNTASSEIEVVENEIFVNGHPLVFFHFHGLKKLQKFWLTSQLNYFSVMKPSLIDLIYEPYARRLDILDLELPEEITTTYAQVRKGKGVRGVAANLARSFFGTLSLFLGQAFILSGKTTDWKRE